MSVVNSIQTSELEFYWMLMNASPAIMDRGEFRGGMEMLIKHAESDVLRTMCRKNLSRFDRFGSTLKVAKA
jgi:hypothetical protein